MRIESLQLLVPIGTLVTVVALWAGVIYLRKMAGKLPWCLMLAGVILMTLFSLGSLFGLHGMVLFRSSFGFQLWRLGSNFGYVTFAIGFALHAVKVARTAERQAELEQLANAMSEEIDRMKGSPRP